MTHAGVLAVAALIAAAVAAPARASFGPPVQLATGSYGIGVAADTDGAGSTTAIVSGYGRGPRLFERPAGGAWSAAAPLPGNPAGMAGPVVDAAGGGALGIAWRVDKPRSYTGIAVALRDPGGTLGATIEIAGADARGVRHPALAIDPAGDALLAYNSATNEVHLNMRGAITITHRTSGGSFAPPTVVDATPSSPPAVAMGRDGTGVVAWTHDRRLYVVSVGADGQIGKVKRIASPDGVVGLVAAAGERGAATLAWVNHRAGAGTPRSPRNRYFVRALGRTAGNAFGATRAVASTSEYVRGVSIAADQGGQVTLAWGREHFGTDRSVGIGGVTSAVLAATTQVGRPFPAPQVVARRGRRYLTPPGVAAANGRVALTWGSTANRRNLAVQAAVGPAGAIGPPQTVAAKTLKQSSFGFQRLIEETLAPNGAVTVFYVEPTEMPPPAPAFVVNAADGP
jgi:hypothetical protein